MILYKLEIPALDNLNGDFPIDFQKEFFPYVLSELPEETALVKGWLLLPWLKPGLKLLPRMSLS